MFARAATVLIAGLCLANASAFAQPSAILFENVRIFDGKSSTLSGSGMNVLVRGNTIDRISKDPIAVDRSAGTRIIAGGGRHNITMMRQLSGMLAARVIAAEQVGWNGDALEAEGFAFLAVRSLYGMPLSLPQTTGCYEPTTGGIFVRPQGLS